MKTVARVGVPIALVAVVLAVAAVCVFAGVTEPGHDLFGISARHADIAACWAIFLGLPLACAVDASLLDNARWHAARRSKPAWVFALVYAPVVGPLLYVTFARPRVSGAPATRLPRTRSAA
jgi:hypothetical protein